MKKFTFLFLITLYSVTSYAQTGVLRKELSEKGTVTFAEFRVDSLPKSMRNAKPVLKELLSTDQDDDFVLTSKKTDELGISHQYFDQYYKGVRVAYSSYAVHGKDDLIKTVNGSFNRIGKVATTPKLSEKEALARALDQIGAKTYKWNVPEEEQWAKKTLGTSYYPKGELVIVKDRLKTNQQFRLAWAFDIYAHQPFSRDLVYIDALSGEMIDKDSKIHHTNSPGTATTRYSGNRAITTDSFTGGFRLRETRNSVPIETFNLRGRGTAYAGSPDFTDNDNNWTAAEFNNANMDNAALDAHWGAEMVYDYFNTVHGRNSWNGSGGSLRSFVHADLSAFGLSTNDNAFWDGEKMTYGDGTFLDPLTSLDICAHEIGHGINSSSAKIRNESESGALNEALSDIWAACVENWAASTKQTWIMGEDVSFGFGTRSMSDPNAFSQPDTYQSPSANGFWFNTNGCTPSNANDKCGVHTNMGVVNFWFFLTTMGGTGTNDLGNCYNVTGIGIDKAARIVYRAETVILFSNSQQTVSFSQFRQATITAAANLYGVGSAEVAAVANAWHAVGVGNAFQYSISGPSAVCSGGTPFTISNVPAGATVTWSVSANLTIVSGQGTTSAVIAPVTTGATGAINASVSCPGVAALQKSVWLGTPSATGLNLAVMFGPSQNSLCWNVELGIGVFQPGTSGATDYSWSFSSWDSYFVAYDISPTTGPHGIARFLVNSTTPTPRFLSVRGVNNCGLSPQYSEAFSAINCNGGGGGPGGPLMVNTYPVPTADYLTITVDSAPAGEDVQVKILNSNSERVYETILKDTKVDVPAMNLPNGIYYIQIIQDGKIKETRRIQVKH